MSIRTKLIVALFAGVLVVAGAAAGIMRFVHERALSQAVRHEIAQSSRALEQIEAMELERLGSLADVLVRDPRLADRFEARDRAGLLALAAPIFEVLRDRHGVTHWYFHPPAPARDGVFLRVHRPNLFGDPVRRPVVARAARERRVASGRELGRTAYAVRLVIPWERNGRLLGFLELGEDVPSFLGRLRALTGEDHAMALDKGRLDRAAWEQVPGTMQERWDARSELLVVHATGEAARQLGGLDRLADVPEEATALGELDVGSRRLVRGVYPLRDEAGAKIGGVLVLHDVTALHAGVHEVRSHVIGLVVFLAAGLAALVIFLLEALVFERLSRMMRALEDLPGRLERGEALDLDQLGPRRDDEIGRFEAFFERALRQVGSFVADVRRERPPGVRRRLE